MTHLLKKKGGGERLWRITLYLYPIPYTCLKSYKMYLKMILNRDGHNLLKISALLFITAVAWHDLSVTFT